MLGDAQKKCPILKLGEKLFINGVLSGNKCEVTLKIGPDIFEIKNIAIASAYGFLTGADGVFLCKLITDDSEKDLYLYACKDAFNIHICFSVDKVDGQVSTTSKQRIVNLHTNKPSSVAVHNFYHSARFITNTGADCLRSFAIQKDSSGTGFVATDMNS